MVLMVLLEPLHMEVTVVIQLVLLERLALLRAVAVEQVMLQA
jgi:hypothetical protein